jgi:CRP-like cAMP-binding protein
MSKSRDMMLFAGGSGQDLPTAATFVPLHEMSDADKNKMLEEYRIWRAFGNPSKCKHFRQMVKRVLVVLRYVRRFKIAATDHDARRRGALLKPPGPGRKIGDLKLIAETLGRLAWIKRLPDPDGACQQLAPHVVMRCIRRGTVVFKEGDAPDYFHLIMSGGVDITRNESLSKPSRVLWNQASALAGEESKWGQLFHTMAESLNDIEKQENEKRAELARLRADRTPRSGTAAKEEGGLKMLKKKANWGIALSGVISQTQRKGITVLLSQLGEGDGFGDSSFLFDAGGDATRHSTCTASDDTELISIDCVGFKKFLCPQVEGKISGRVAFLRSMGLFSGVDRGTVGDRVLARIARVLVERTYKLGEVMARQDESNDQIFMLLVAQGRARVIREVTAEAATRALQAAKGLKPRESRESSAATPAAAAAAAAAAEYDGNPLVLPGTKKAKGESHVLPPPPTKLTRAAHKRVEAYVACARHHGGPDAKLPLELDVLDKGHFYLRGFTNMVTGLQVKANTSLIAKEPNTVAYVINKWDFLRLVGDVPGCDTLEDCQARAAEYEDDTRSVAEWFVGAAWEAYRGELSTQAKQTGEIVIERTKNADRMPPGRYKSEVGHAVMRAELLNADASVINVPAPDGGYASRIVSYVGAGGGGGGQGGLLGSPRGGGRGGGGDYGGSPRVGGGGRGGRGRRGGGASERRGAGGVRVSFSEGPSPSGAADGYYSPSLNAISKYGPAPSTADALAHVGSITGLRHAPSARRRPPPPPAAASEGGLGSLPPLATVKNT